MIKYEVNSEFRLMASEDLIYILTNKECKTDNVSEGEFFYGEGYDLNVIFEKMTPCRKKLVMAGIELYNRYNAQKENRTRIYGGSDVFNLMQPVMGNCLNEEAWVIYLNHASRIIRKQRISTGGLTSAIVDVRMILKEALLCNATCFILCHNHPSGNNTPSREDDNLTQSVKVAAKTMNIQLLDHVIICSNSYYSYIEEGRL